MDKRWIMYLVVGSIVVAMLTHPAGTAVGLTGVTNLVTGESAILAGQGQAGGTHGTIVAGSTTYAL